MKTCKNCGRTLPDEEFELYPTGTRRGVCRQCKYTLYGIKAKKKWHMRERALAMGIKSKGRTGHR